MNYDRLTREMGKVLEYAKSLYDLASMYPIPPVDEENVRRWYVEVETWFLMHCDNVLYDERETMRALLRDLQISWEAYSQEHLSLENPDLTFSIRGEGATVAVLVARDEYHTRYAVIDYNGGVNILYDDTMANDVALAHVGAPLSVAISYAQPISGPIPNIADAVAML